MDRPRERRSEYRGPDQRRSEDGWHRYLCQGAWLANATMWLAQPRPELCRLGETPAPTPSYPAQVRWTESCVLRSADRQHATSPLPLSTVMLPDYCRMIALRVSRCVRARCVRARCVRARCVRARCVRARCVRARCVRAYVMSSGPCPILAVSAAPAAGNVVSMVMARSPPALQGRAWCAEQAGDYALQRRLRGAPAVPGHLVVS